MHLRVAAACVAACLISPAVCLAQTTAEPTSGVVAAADSEAPGWGDSVIPPPSSLFDPLTEHAPDTGYWAPFKAIPRDFTRFFSSDTMKVVGLGGVGALTLHPWDGEGIEESQKYLRPSLFRPGSIGGGFLIQTGASVGLYSIARLAGSGQLAAAGADLIRAHVLSQGVVHAGKFATRRTRPDASNNQSLPSGHTASAFTTATVLQQHFGWKVGIPAYGFGAYVAASRMSANKHYLSDVVLGAAIGIAAGRTVTIGSGRTRLQMGVAPTLGGAAITVSTASARK